MGSHPADIASAAFSSAHTNHRTVASPLYVLRHMSPISAPISALKALSWHSLSCPPCTVLGVHSTHVNAPKTASLQRSRLHASQFVPYDDRCLALPHYLFIFLCFSSLNSVLRIHRSPAVCFTPKTTRMHAPHLRRPPCALFKPHFECIIVI